MLPRAAAIVLRRHEFLWLLALACALVFLALQPLLSFALFGSDTGEYFRLTQTLVTTGHLPLSNYAGWGFAYPDFPGIFLLAGATSAVTGTDVLSSLITVIPVVAVLSVLPLFLLFRRLLGNASVAILGAGFASVAMPRLFSIAHPAPLALGDFFAVAALWMFVEGRTDRRWYLPLALTGAALIVTHHLSSYFFLVSALGGLLLLELVRPGRWSRRFPVRELAFLGAFTFGLIAYWSAYATEFQSILPQGLYGLPTDHGLVLVAGALVGFLVVAALIRWARHRARPSAQRRVRLPADASIVRDFAIILGGTLVGVVGLIAVDLPGTSQTTTLGAVVFFLPLIVTIALAAGSRRLLLFSRPGPYLLTWLAALSLSAVFAIVTGNTVLPPERHAEYLLIPLGLMAAVALGRTVARLGDRAGRPAALAGSVAVVLLLAANAAIVYPPPQDFGGFQEGLTNADAALWGWVGVALPPTAVVATDHRLSSMIFGFDGNPATWSSTPLLFLGTNRTAALAELAGSFAPHGTLKPVDAVAVDAVMHQGVALDPNQFAYPMSPQAVAWLAQSPFIPLYANGLAVVYWVAGPPTG